MRLLCPLVLILALVAIVAARISNVTWTSYFKTLKQRLNDESDEYLQENLILKDTLKEKDDGEDTVERLRNGLKQRTQGRQVDILHGPIRGGPYGPYGFNDLNEIGTFGISTPKSMNLGCGGKYVDSIQMTYKIAGGTTRAAPKRGGSGGQPVQFILHDDDERIVKVTGSAGKYIDSLEFHTNKGRVSNNCGHTGGQRFTEQYPGYVLSYISGVTGKYVDQIQLHWVHEELQYIMSSVNYDLKNARRVDKESPLGIYTAELTNRSPIEQAISYTRTITTSESEMWSFNYAVTTGVAVTAKAGIPLVFETQISITTASTFGFTSGKAKTVEYSSTHTLSTMVPGNSKMNVTLIIFEAVIEIPFTTDLTVVYGDGTQVTKTGERGMFKGVQAARSIPEYGKPAPLIDSKHSI